MFFRRGKRRGDKGRVKKSALCVRVVGFSDVFSAPSLIKLIKTFAKEKKGGELFERIFNTADVFSLSLFSLFLKIVGFLQSFRQIFFRFSQTRPKLSFFVFVFVSFSLLSSRRRRQGHQHHKTTALIWDDDCCERNM